MSRASMDRERALAICEQAIEACGADEVMVHLGVGSSALTRFANNHIHQNVAEENGHLSVRAFVGRRSGIATGNDLSDAGIRDTAARALALARLALKCHQLLWLSSPQAQIERPQHCANSRECRKCRQSQRY